MNEFVLEALVSALECNFERFGDEIVRDFEHIAKLFSSVPVENCHRV